MPKFQPQYGITINSSYRLPPTEDHTLSCNTRDLLAMLCSCSVSFLDESALAKLIIKAMQFNNKNY